MKHRFVMNQLKKNNADIPQCLHTKLKKKLKGYWDGSLCKKGFFTESFMKFQKGPLKKELL